MRIVEEPSVSWETVIFHCQQENCGAGVMFEKADLRDRLRVNKPPRVDSRGVYTARAQCPFCNHPNSLFVGRREP